MGVLDSGGALEDMVATVEAFYRRYEPKEVLGRGISSVVRRCVNRATKRDFAVKIVDLNSGGANQDCTAEELRDMAMKEIEVLRYVHEHPNIMMLADVFETEAHMFIVTELCPGGELFDYITREVTLSEKRTRVIMRQVLSALEHMHSRHIVHRDIKLENILLADSAHLDVRIADFGFAVSVTSDTDLCEGMGTLGYLAPEILLYVHGQIDEGYGRPVDLWAAGVVMFNLLSGSPPFTQRRRMFQSIRDGRYSFDSPAWEEVSDTAKDLISRLMDVDPHRRLTAAEALRHEFFQHLEPPGVVPLGGEAEHFDARRSWRRGLLAVRTLVRLDQLSRMVRPMPLSTVTVTPYRQRRLRRMIDNAAFHIYNHWVKKGEEQNRAALFQNVIASAREDSESDEERGGGGGDETPTVDSKGKIAW